MANADKQLLQVIYDHQCPFCTGYVKLLRLKERYEVELIDARSAHPVLAEISERSFDLDEGMVVRIEQHWFFGADAVQRLALLSSDTGLLRRLGSWVLADKRRSRWLYPLLRGGRNLALRILGTSKIRNLDLSAD